MPTKLEKLKAEYREIATKRPYNSNDKTSVWSAATRDKYKSKLDRYIKKNPSSGNTTFNAEEWNNEGKDDLIDAVWLQILDEYERIIDDKDSDWIKTVFSDIESTTVGRTSVNRLRFPTEQSPASVPMSIIKDDVLATRAKACIKIARDEANKRVIARDVAPPASWYAQTAREAHDRYNSFGENLPIASQIFPTENKKFPFFQIVRGDGACYFNAAIVAILNDCVGNVENWKSFRKNLVDFGCEDIANQIGAEGEILTREKVAQVLQVQGDENIVRHLTARFVVPNNEYYCQQALTRVQNFFARTNPNLETVKKGMKGELLTKEEFQACGAVGYNYYTKQYGQYNLYKNLVEYAAQNQALGPLQLIASSYEDADIEPIVTNLYPGKNIISLEPEAFNHDSDLFENENNLYLHNAGGHFNVIYRDLDGRIRHDVDKLMNRGITPPVIAVSPPSTHSSAKSSLPPLNAEKIFKQMALVANVLGVPEENKVEFYNANFEEKIGEVAITSQKYKGVDLVGIFQPDVGLPYVVNYNDGNWNKVEEWDEANSILNFINSTIAPAISRIEAAQRIEMRMEKILQASEALPKIFNRDEEGASVHIQLNDDHFVIFKKKNESDSHSFRLIRTQSDNQEDNEILYSSGSLPDTELDGLLDDLEIEVEKISRETSKVSTPPFVEELPSATEMIVAISTAPELKNSNAKNLKKSKPNLEFLRPEFSEKSDFIDDKFDFSTNDQALLSNPLEGSQAIILNNLQEAAAKAGISADDAGIFILLAIKNGGIGHKEREVKKDLAKFFNDDEIDGAFAKAKKFSATFQTEMEKSKMFTGNQNAAELSGMRLKRLTPDYVLKMYQWRSNSTESPEESFVEDLKALGTSVEKLKKKTTPSVDLGINSVSTRSFHGTSDNDRVA